MTQVPLSRKRRSNIFVVDTKSTCFLCLTEIPTVVELDSDDDEPGKAGSGNQSEKYQFCMRTIYKYLKINTGKLLTTKVAGVNNSHLLKADLAVSLCENCRPIVETLSKLCLELELVQMKVNHKLQQFLEVIKRSQEDGNKTTRFRSKMRDPLELLQASVAELMRKETETKCSKRLDGVFPVVNMASGETAMINSKAPVSVPTLVPTKTATTSTGPTTFVPPLLAPPPLPPPSVSLSSVNVVSSLTFGDLPPPPTRLLPETECNILKAAALKCPLCSMPFAGIDGFKGHIMRKHPDQPSLKPLTVTPVVQPTCNACGLKLNSKADWIRHTRLYCSLKRSGTRSEVPAKKTVVTSPPTSNCTPYSAPTSSSFQHLVDTFPYTKTSSNSLLCSLCPPGSAGYNFQAQLMNHAFCIHPKYFFQPVQFPECSSAEFEKLIEELITRELNLCLTATSGSTYKCLYCNNLTYIRRNMNIHLVQVHHKELSSKLQDLQKPVLPPPPPPIVQQRQPPPLKNNFRPRRITAPAVKKYSCDDCGTKFTQTSALYRHRRTRCNRWMEMVLEVPQPLPSEARETEEHVCPVCCKKFNKLRNLKRHVRRNNCAPPPLVSSSSGGGGVNREQNEDGVPLLTGSFSLATIPISVVPMMVPPQRNVMVVNEVMSTTEDNQEEMFFGGEEDEEAQDFQENYGHTSNIQIMEAQQIHLMGQQHQEQKGEIKTNFKMEEEVIIMDGGTKVEGTDMYFNENEQDQEQQMMILPDTEDPLQF